MKDCEQLLQHVANSCLASDTICYSAKTIVLNEVFTRVTVRDAFNEYTDVKMEDAVRDGSFDELMVTRIEPALVQDKPVLLVDYPMEMAALARPKPGDPAVAERSEEHTSELQSPCNLVCRLL